MAVDAPDGSEAPPPGTSDSLRMAGPVLVRSAIRDTHTRTHAHTECSQEVAIQNSGDPNYTTCVRVKMVVIPQVK